MIASFANPKIPAVNSVANRHYNIEPAAFRSNGIRSDCYPNAPVDAPRRILRYDDPFHYESTMYPDGRLAAPKKEPMREVRALPFIGLCTEEAGIPRSEYHQPSFYLSSDRADRPQRHEQGIDRAKEEKKMAVQRMVAERRVYEYRDDHTDISDPSGMFPVADGAIANENTEPVDDSEPTDPFPEVVEQAPQDANSGGDAGAMSASLQGAPPGKGVQPPSQMYGRPA